MEGQTLSHYRVLEKLGGGGMGVVYKALDTKLNRHVALKFLPPELTRDDDARERFILEAQAASALDHPKICTIHEIDATPEGHQFIAMAYYEGETLKKRIARGPLPVAEALDIAMQVAQGLSKAHDAGIIHRDIKPANLMFTKDGLVKIVDFGIAKLLGVTGPTQTGTTLGTVSYMAPEQINGEEADQQTDVWALGAVLYEMLTGQTPFQGDRPVAVMNAISNRTPDSPHALRAEIPAGVASVVIRALEKPTDKRYPSAAAFLADTKTSHTELTQPVLQAAAAGSPWQALLMPKVFVPVLLVLLTTGVAGLWSVRSRADVRWARDEALPEVVQLIEQRSYAQAFDLAERAAEYIPDDPTLADLWPQMSTSMSLQTTPTGAEVYVKDYADIDGDWRLAGVTPIVDGRLSTGPKRWEIGRWKALHRS